MNIISTTTEKLSQFNYTQYNQAKEYLISIGKYEEFMNNGFSTDGYSLVNCANAYKKGEIENG